MSQEDLSYLIVGHLLKKASEFLDFHLKRVMQKWVPYIKAVKRQFHNMVKHTQTIRRQIADELFECLTILWDWSLMG